MTTTVALWPSSTQMAPLEEVARQAGGAGALRWLREACPEVRVAYLHGDRHDLFWEFRLIDSLRWQAHLSGLSPALFQPRCQQLAKGLGLSGLLDRQVEELTPSQRARADLAAALLPGPDVLIWEEPFLLLSPADQIRVASVIRHHCFAAGLSVLAIATKEPGLGALGHLHPLQATR